MADEVVLKLRGTSAELVQAVNAATASVKGLNVSVTQLNNTPVAPNFKAQMGDISAGLRTAGAGMTAAITLPLLALGGSALKVASDFDTAFSGVRKAMADADPKDLAMIRSELIRISEVIPATTEELANIAQMGAQFGIAAKDLPSFTTTVAQLGVAAEGSGLTMEAAATALAKIRNVTGDSVEGVSRMASVLVELGNKGASSEQEIIAFTERLTGIGKTVDMTTPQIFALGATLANLGINAELGSTAISRTIQQMMGAVASGGDELQAFSRISGLTAEQFASQWKKDPTVAIGAFVQGLADMKNRGENVIEALHGLGAESIRQVGTLLQMATASQNANGEQGKLAYNVKIATQAFKDGDAHVKAANERYSTLTNQTKLLTNEFKNALRPLGEDIVGAMKASMPAIRGVIETFGDLIKGIREMPAAVQVGIFGAVGLLAAAGPAIYVGGTMIDASMKIWKLVDAIRGLQAAQAAATLGGVGTGATAAAGGLTALGVALGTAGAVVGVIAGAIVFTAEIMRMNAIIKEADSSIGSFRATLISIASNPAVMALLGALNPGASSGATSTRLSRPGAGAPRGDTNLPVDPFSVPSATSGSFGSTFGLSGGGAGGATSGTAVGMDAIRARVDVYESDMARVGEASFKTMAREHDLGESIKALANQFGVSVSSLTRYIELQKEGGKAANKTAAETRKWAILLAEVAQANEPLTLAQKDQIKTLEGLGVSHSKIATFIGATDAQVKKYNESLKEESKLLSEVGEKMRDIPRNVPLRLETRDLSGAVPQINVDAVKKASETAGAIKQINDATWGDIEGRMKAAGVFTQDVLGQMATSAREEYDSMKASGLYTAEQLREAWQRWYDADRKARGKWQSSWLIALDVIGRAVDMLGGMFGGSTGKIINSIGGVVNNLKVAQAENLKWGGSSGIASAMFSDGASKTEKASAGIASGMAIANGAMDVWAVTSAAGTKSSAAFGGAMAGAKAGAAFGPYGAAVGAVAGAVTGMIRAMSAGRREIKAFAESFNTAALGTGFDEMHAQLLEAGREDLWIKATQKTKKGDKAGALAVEAEIKAALEKFQTNDPARIAAASYQTKAQLQEVADKAASVYEYMKNSGLYSAEAIADAFEKSKAAQIAAMSDTEKAQADALEKITAKYKESMDKLDAEYKKLSDSVAAEAEEESMGAQETLDRARMAQIEKEKAALETKKADEIAAAKAIAEGTTEATGGALSDLQQKLLDQKKYWDDWAEQAVAAAKRVQAGVDGVTFGNSPGGLKEIAPMLRKSGTAVQDFSTLALRQFRDVGAAIDRIGPPNGTGSIGLGQRGQTIVIEEGSIVFDRAIVKDREAMQELSRELIKELRTGISSEGGWR